MLKLGVCEYAREWKISGAMINSTAGGRQCLTYDDDDGP